MSPRRPTRKQIYRRRRIVVMAALLALLLLVSFSVYSLARGVGAIGALLDPDGGTAVTRQSVPAVEDKGGIRDCSSDDVSLSLVPKSHSVPVGGSLDFTATVRYERSGASEGCVMDVSNASLVLTIVSGEDEVWRSDSCPSTARRLLFAKGDSDAHAITWNTNRTGGECAEDATLPHVEAGTYVARLSMRDDATMVSDKVPIVVS